MRKEVRARAPLDDLSGLAAESREAHLERHAGGVRSCPRCRWYKFEQSWTCSYGKDVTTSGVGPRGNVIWLSERPARWGGSWGLGCNLCAAFVARAATPLAAGQGQTPARLCRLGTAWARYEVRPATLQAEHSKQHGVYSIDRMAVAALLSLDEPLKFAAQASLADEKLLAGAVPQPPDWLSSWRAAITPKSWQAAGSELETEHYVYHMLRARGPAPRAGQHGAHHGRSRPRQAQAMDT